MEPFQTNTNNPFTPVYTPSGEQSLDFIPMIDYTYGEKLKAVWQTVHDDEAGDSLDQRYIYGDNDPKNYKTGKLLEAKDANDLYPVDIPYTKPVHEDEAKFIKNKYDKQQAYNSITSQLDPLSSFVFGTAVDITGNLASYAALNAVAGVAGAAALRAFKGTSVATKALSVFKRYKQWGASSAAGRIGQVSLGMGLEEAAEELAISPFRGQMALESGRQYGYEDIASSVGEGFVGGAALGGVIGTGISLFENRASVYNNIHKFYNKAFSKEKAANLAAKAEIDTSMGYVPNTEAILSKYDETIEPNISEDVEYTDSTDFGGFIDGDTASLSSSNIPLEANFGQGIELSNFKSTITNSNADTALSIDTSQLVKLDLDLPFSPEVKAAISNYFLTKYGIPLSEASLSDSSPMTGFSFLKDAIKSANVLHVDVDHATEFNKIINSITGADAYTYTAGTTGETSPITSDKKHKATFILEGSQGKVKVVKADKVKPTGDKKASNVDSAKAAEYYKKPEALQNFDKAAQLAIDTFKKMSETQLDGDMFEKTFESKISELADAIKEEISELTNIKEQLNQADEGAKYKEDSELVGEVQSAPIPNVKYTFEAMNNAVKTDSEGFATNLSEIIFWHGGFNLDETAFDATTKSSNDIFYAIGKYFSNKYSESNTYAKMGKSKQSGGKSSVAPYKFNPDAKILKVTKDPLTAKQAALVDKIINSLIKNFDGYDIKPNASNTYITSMKALFGYIRTIPTKDDIKPMWNLVTSILKSSGIDGLVIPNSASFTTGYQLEAVLFQTKAEMDLTKNVALLNEKKIDSLKAIIDKVNTKEEYSKYMKSILFCSRKPE